MSVSLANWGPEDDGADVFYDPANDIDYGFLSDKLNELETDDGRKKVSDEYLCHQNNYLSYINHLLSDSNDDFEPEPCSPDSDDESTDDEKLTLEEQEGLLAEGRLQYAINNDLPWDKKLDALTAYMITEKYSPKTKYLIQLFNQFQTDNIERSISHMTKWKAIVNNSTAYFDPSVDDNIIDMDTVDELNAFLKDWDEKDAKEQASIDQNIRAILSQMESSKEFDIDLHRQLVTYNKQIRKPDQYSLNEGLRNVQKFLNKISRDDQILTEIVSLYYDFNITNDESRSFFNDLQSQLLRRNGGNTRIIVRFRNEDVDGLEQYKHPVKRLPVIPETKEEAKKIREMNNSRGVMVYEDNGIKTISTRKDSKVWIPLQIGLTRNLKARSIHELFTPSSTQKQVFESVEDLLLNATDGKSVCLAFYGGSGSGKTHTALGDGKGDDGILPQLLNKITADPEKTIKIQCLETLVKQSGYQQHDIVVKDLQINQTVTFKNKLRNPQYSIWDDIEALNMKTAEDAKEFYEACQEKRKTGNNGVHKKSSRSHLFFKITVTQGNKESYVFICDLAGKEDITKWIKTQPRQERQFLKEESDFINRSLEEFIAQYRRKKSGVYNSKTSYGTSYESGIKLPLKKIFDEEESSLALIVCLYPVLLEAPYDIVVRNADINNKRLSEEEQKIRNDLHGAQGLISRIIMNHNVLQSFHGSGETIAQDQTNRGGWNKSSRFRK